MATIDFRKELDFLYKASVKKPEFTDVPAFNFMMVNGSGDPNDSEEFQEAINLLYNISWTIKMLPKKKIIPEGWFNYVVPPLEGLWWTDGEKFTIDNKSEWKWSLMIMQPEFVTADLVSQTLNYLRETKPGKNYSKLRLENLHEGIAIQMMHIGPYESISVTVEKIDELMKEKGFVVNGKHHEIYLSDHRKVVPEKMKTLVRVPVRKI